MPTARELLEQADALMRRNRSPMLDDIPVLTDSVGAIPPPRVTRGRAPLAPEPDSSGPDTIPTLTESIETEPEAEAAPPPVPEPASPSVTVVEEGEPSDWLQLGQGEPSAIGEAPDSIAVVPDVEPEPAPPEESPDEEIEITATASEAEEAFDEEIAVETPPTMHAEPPPSASLLASAYAGGEVKTPDTSLIEGDTVSDMEAVDEAPAESSRASEAIEDELFGAPPEPVPAPVVDAAAERARWESMAEEIRVQVLQRIDLFTDTGLREQLGARLQPIVDRASADLVATINQHVGELLRAYVAEAIEREIENWRRDH